jgi:hypothetical protein
MTIAEIRQLIWIVVDVIVDGIESVVEAWHDRNN